MASIEIKNRLGIASSTFAGTSLALLTKIEKSRAADGTELSHG
jgi:hypothetical protein